MRWIFIITLMVGLAGCGTKGDPVTEPASHDHDHDHDHAGHHSHAGHSHPVQTSVTLHEDGPFGDYIWRGWEYYILNPSGNWQSVVDGKTINYRFQEDRKLVIEIIHPAGEDGVVPPPDRLFGVWDRPEDYWIYVQVHENGGPLQKYWMHLLEKRKGQIVFRTVDGQEDDGSGVKMTMDRVDEFVTNITKGESTE